MVMADKQEVKQNRLSMMFWDDVGSLPRSLISQNCKMRNYQFRSRRNGSAAATAAPP